MAFQNLSEKAVAKKLIQKLSVVAKSQGESEEEISSIVSTYGLASIVSEDKLGDSYNLSGRVESTVVFETKNKTLSSLNVSFDFDAKTGKISDEWVYSVPSINKIKAVNTSSGTIEINAIIDIDIYAIVKQEIKYIGVDGLDYEIKSNTKTIDELACATADTFTVVNNIEFGENLTKLISVCPLYNIKKISYQDNYIVIDGEIISEIICLCGENLRKITKTQDFSEEVAMIGAKKDMLIDSCLRLQNVETNYEVFESQNKTNINVSNIFKVNVFGFNKKEVNLIEDLFSTSSETLITSECSNVARFVGLDIVSEKLNVNYDASNGTRIDEIITVNNTSVNVVKSVVEEDILTAEVIVVAEIIFKNYELDGVYSTKVEFPMQITSKAEGAKDVDIRATAEVLNYKNRAGKEVVLSFEVNMLASYFSEELICYVSNAEVGDLRKVDDNMLTIYMPSCDETTFDIAKKLNVKKSELKQQNPDVTEDKMPERVVLYRMQ